MTDRIAPLAIGPRNCEQMVGHPWRWLRDHADELGVEVIKIDGKSCILAAPLLAALEMRATAAPDAQPTDERHELAAMRARFGKVRRTG